MLHFYSLQGCHARALLLCLSLSLSLSLRRDASGRFDIENVPVGGGRGTRHLAEQRAKLRLRRAGRADARVTVALRQVRAVTKSLPSGHALITSLC